MQRHQPSLGGKPDKRRARDKRRQATAQRVAAQHGALGGHPLGGGLAAFVACASLVGFSTKAGLMPLHSWLPRAHPLAPAHISALKSGGGPTPRHIGLVTSL